MVTTLASLSESNKENTLTAPNPSITPTSNPEDDTTDTTLMKRMEMVPIDDNYGETSTLYPDKHFIDKVSNTILLYYYDKLTLDTNVLYGAWSDLALICTSKEVEAIKIFYHKLIESGYKASSLPVYEMLRYYHGTSRDLTRALTKWKGAIDTFSYYNLRHITAQDAKQCMRIMSKSCHFCGFHGVDIGKPSPVFVLNYENWNWSEFDDINHVIKASFYICSWMTDSIDAINNGLTLMINCKGIAFNHIRQAMSLMRAIQKSLALRTNHVFFLNLPSLAKSSMKLFLKIYPKHIQDKIHICSSTNSLFESLTIDQIPMIFGGDLNRDSQHKIPCLSTILSNYIDIKDFDHFQVDEDHYRYY